MTITATTPIQFLRGVGPYLAERLNKRSVYTALDLLFYLPVKYIDRRLIHSLKTLPLEKKQTFLAQIDSYHIKKFGPRGQRKILEILVKDKNTFATVSFFKFHHESLMKKFPVGSQVLFLGDVKLYRGLKSISHPDMELMDEEDPEFSTPLLPFYPLTEGLHQKSVRQIIDKNLDELLTLIEDESRSVREEGGVKLDLTKAFLCVHKPPLDSDLEALNQRNSVYHKRIIYDEFFYLQLGLISKRYQNQKQESFAISSSKKLVPLALSQMPFELTQDQKSALGEIESDFKSAKPMNRMLQGDVGSGKTVVAWLSALMAIEAGLQVAVMAPTEILAEQHYQYFLKFEEALGVRVECLTSSTSAKKRAEILGNLRAGSVDLVVGTHALITFDVQFLKLGFVVIDEQHRFGVLQRAALKNKVKTSINSLAPHLLAMTATPIPRTLSMTLYGDLDVSIIKELPKGRKPIVTELWRENKRAALYDFIKEELKRGRQVYFVYPLVQESEKMDLKNATDMCQTLVKEFEAMKLEHKGMAPVKVALLHGKMRAEEKENIMLKFKAHEVDILVSTTVIEVGVDVPNASVMVIEHAERFGLSQLHQLRGRVGRGSEKSYCFLMASYAQSEESRFRLKVMKETHDGFVIAEEDLKLRGPGEFLGIRQAGLPDFHLAELVRDSQWLTLAKKRATEILKEDPDLTAPINQKLKKIMLERWAQKLDLMMA